MLRLLAHGGQPPAPHDVWSAWNLDPVLLIGLALLVWAHREGRTPSSDRRRGGAFGAAVAVIAVALVSPLEAMTSALASAHMVQHVLLVVVAAPLLAFSAPSARLLRALPPPVLRAGAGTGHVLGLTPRRLRILRHPALVWVLHVTTLWVWHSAAAYGTTLDSTLVHVGAHAAFVVTGVLVWRVVLGPVRVRLPGGAAVLVVFGLAMQGVLLSLLLTFAEQPWYGAYASSTQPWGLTPLADQQLAGAIMWVPTGIVHLLIALVVLGRWLQETDRQAVTGATTPSGSSLS